MLDILVQNYYERNGSFDGIENTYLYKGLMQTMHVTGESKEDLCYRLLGYTGAESAKNYADLRLKLLQNSEWRSMITEKRNRSDLIKLFKMNQNTKDVKLIKDKNLKGLDKLIASYYQNDIYNRIQDDGLMIPFGIWLKQSRVSTDKLLSDDRVKKCLVSFQKKDIEYPTICGKVLYCNKDLSEAEQLKLQRSAISYVRFSGSPLKAWSRLPIMQLLTQSVANRDIYLQMLDYTRFHDITYAELLSKFDLRVPDLLQSYKVSHVAFMYLNDKVLYYNEGNKVWNITDLESFQLFCSIRENQPLEDFRLFPMEPIKYPFIKG